MSEWIVCPVCRLKHRPRTGAVCPRCGAGYQPPVDPPGGAPGASAAPEAPAAGPAPEDPHAAGDPAPTGGRRRRVVVAIALALLVCAAAAVELKLREAPDPQDRAVATFVGGRITQREVEEEIRSLPPGLKRDIPEFANHVAAALVFRRALAIEATARGLGSALWREHRERRLVRALLEAEGFGKPRTAAEASAHFKKFHELAENKVRGLRIDDAALRLIPFDPDAPLEPRPREASVPAAEEPFFLENRWSCAGVIHGDARWYTGFCNSEEAFPRLLLPGEVMYLESTYGPVEGFLHGFAFDGARHVGVRVSFGTAHTADALPSTAPEVLRQYGLALVDIEVSGSVTPEAAEGALERVAAPLRNCEAWSRRLSRYSEKEATVVVHLRVEDGRVVDGRVDDLGFIEPPPIAGASVAVDRAWCLWPLKTYRVEGRGEIRYRFRATAP